MPSKPQLETPVALLVFKRPEHTKRVFEKIREARPKQLFLIADGPRNDAERKQCEATRKVVEHIDWPCEVMRDYSEVNMGCDPRTVSGISWALSHVDRIIFFEDDDVPHADFFPFCEELLEKYKDDSRIMHIAGANYQQKNSGFKINESYFFSTIPFNHGMATWRRAWNLYDSKLSSWPAIKKDVLLESVFPDPAVRVHWEYKFDQFHSGKLTSWDGKWAYACVVNHGLSINPRVSLISNIGYGVDAEATHTTRYNPDQADLETRPLAKPYIHPPSLIPNAQAEAFTYLTHFGINRALKQRAVNWVRFAMPKTYSILRASKQRLVDRQKLMRSDWESRGNENAYGWVMTEKTDWNKEEYYKTGASHVKKYVEPLFGGKDLSQMTALDVGCGTGRMTRFMRFGRVIGTDVSPSMIEKAKADNPGQEYYVNDGVMLAKVADSSVDFVFSYATLQHLTRKQFLKDTFAEISRVLKPGGSARINVRGFPGDARGTVVWWKSFDRFFIALTKIRGIVVPYFRFYDSTFGVCVGEEELKRIAGNFQHISVWRENPRRSLWIDLVK